MLARLRKLLSRVCDGIPHFWSGSLAHAETGGVAIGGDNHAPIFMEAVTLVVPEEPGEDAALAEGFGLCGRVVEQIAHTRFDSATIVPITMVEDDGDGNVASGASEGVALTIETLAVWLEEGRQLLVWGEGGVGKTTVALAVADYFLKRPARRRLPLFLDAAAWAASSEAPLEHITKQAGFAGSALTLANLARLMRAGRLVVLVDGWNELDATLSASAQTRMREFLDNASGLGVLVSSRNARQHPLPGQVNHIRVSGITWPNQQAYIRSELPSGAADALIDMLALRQDIRHAARNALVLQGIVVLHGQGHDLMDRFRIYEAIVGRYEHVPARHAILTSPPLEGCQAEFLRAIAWQMNDAGVTTLPLPLARQSMVAELHRLREASLLDGTANAGSVLRVLQDHHLLFDEGGRLRFAHQRFQEYFAAYGLVQGALAFDPASLARVHAILNQGAWEDSIVLAAETLSQRPDRTMLRGQLIAAALSVDLQFCCELIRITGFSESDNPAAYAELCDVLEALVRSPLDEVRDHAYGCMIDSGLAAFGRCVLTELEHADPSRRLHVYRLGRYPIALRQFSATLMARVSAWPEARIEEMVPEVAGNPENWSWLSDLAFAAPSPEIRAAAISAISWEYPASPAGLDAWLVAPDVVKRHRGLLEAVVEDLRERAIPAMEAELLRVFAGLPDAERARLALQYPETLPAPSTPALTALLMGSGDLVHDNDPALQLLTRRDPAALQAMATDLALTSLRAPAWVDDVLRTLPAEVRATLFERAWNQEGDDVQSLPRLTRLAEGMAPERLRQCLDEWLSLSATFVQQGAGAIDRDRYRLLEDILESADGNVLLAAGLAAAGRSDEALVRLLALRASPQRDGHSRLAWLPDRDQMDLLITTFGMHERDVRGLLAELAVRVDAATYTEVLAGCSRDELDAWGAYEATFSAWLAKGGVGPRPMNPAHGLHLARAWEIVGMRAVPWLLPLAEHPHAGQLVFNALAAVLQEPWAARQPAARPWTPWPNLAAHHRRRGDDKVMAQPDAISQQVTDRAASHVVERVKASHLALQASDLSPMEQRRLEMNVNAGVKALARFPSKVGLPLLVAPWVVDQGSDGQFLDMVAALISQGWRIDAPGVVTRLIRLWDGLTNLQWLDDTQKHWVNLTGTALLLTDGYTFLPEQVAIWRQKSHSHDAVNALVGTRSAESFSLLCACLQDTVNTHHDHDALVASLASAMSAAAVPRLIALLQTGTLFSARSGWSLQQLAQAAAPFLAERPHDLRAALTACSEANSGVAVNFGCSLLASLDDSDALATQFAVAVFEGCRALGSNAPLHFREIFVRRQARGESARLLIPSASNALRSYFYALASHDGPYAAGAKRLLCYIEENRRDGYRPPTEPRHPHLGADSGAWQRVLLAAH